MNKALVLAALAVVCRCAAAQQAPVDAALAQRVQSLALDASRGAAGEGLRVQVRLGQLDARLKLAPCQTVQPYLPPGTRLWGAARIGLRCLDAGVRWNVYLPITVDVYGPGLVAAAPLAAGAVIGAGDLKPAEVKLSATPSPVLTQPPLALGRTLARAVPAGEALRADHLRARQWFAAGDTVRLVAAGPGWRIAGEGLALAPGIDGQTVRVRTESGRVVAGLPIAPREVEVAL